MKQLRIPGPTPCPPEVLQAMGKQMINHRGDEFRNILGDITAKLKQVFQTKNDLLVLTCAGTGVMEAAVVNSLSPGDKVLAVTIGVFGDRFASIAKAFGADVTILKTEMGKAADPEAVRRALQADPRITAVLVTHNETSTGVTNDLAALARVIKGFDKLLVVDAVSSMSSINVPVDEWKLDVVVSGSQKGWMVPPGLAFVSMSEAAWKAQAASKMPKFHFDLARARKSLENGETPWTPNITVFFGLQVGLDMILKEGLPAVFARHARVAQATRTGVKSLGLTLLADERFASNTVTAINASNGLDPKKLTKVMREDHGIVMAGGQASLEGKIFRIGHMGWVLESEIKELVEALRVSLPQAGFSK